MQVSKIEQVCKLLDEYNFKYDSHIIDANLLCGLCGKLLIEARQTPCGCRFCKHCIEEFLKEGSKFCPIGLEKCKEDVLQFNQIIAIDHTINRKILKLRVVCPVTSCTFEDELRNMEQHLIACAQMLVQCPFVAVGCVSPKSEKDELMKHLQMDIYKHTELLLESIDNMKNDLTDTQAQFKRLMKCQSEADPGRRPSSPPESMTIASFLNSIRNSIIVQKFNNANYSLFSIIVLILGVIFCGYVSHVNQLNHELRQLSAQVKRQHDAMELFYRRSEYSGEYVWKIENVSAVIKNASFDSVIYSDSFYTSPNGYKLVLSVSPDCLTRGAMRLRVEQKIGDYDKFLPLNPHFVVTVFVLDQRVWKFANSNIWTGTDGPFKMWISDLPGMLIQNDSVVIRSLISVVNCEYIKCETPSTDISFVNKLLRSRNSLWKRIRNIL